MFVIGFLTVWVLFLFFVAFLLTKHVQETGMDWFSSFTVQGGKREPEMCSFVKV